MSGSSTTSLRVGDVLEEFKEASGTANDDVPVLTLTERNGFVRQSDRFNKRLATEDTSKYKVIRRNDVAFNPYLLWAGAIAQNDRFEAGVISPLYPTFRIRNGFDPSYVKHMLLSSPLISRYDTIAFGSVPRRRRSSVRDFLNLELPAVPPLEEQRRIATILDRASATQNLVARKFENMATARVTLTQHAASLANTLQPLGELLERIDNGKSPTCEDRPADRDEWAVLKLGAVSSGVFKPEENKALRPETEPNPGHEVHSGDVLFSRKNTKELVGVTALVQATPPRLLLPDLIFRLVPQDKAPVMRSYLAGVLMLPSVRHRLVGLAGGSAASMVNISKSKLLKFEVPLPAMKIQQRLDEQLAALNRMATHLGRQEFTVRTLIQSLQSRAFQGEL